MSQAASLPTPPIRNIRAAKKYKTECLPGGERALLRSVPTFRDHAFRRNTHVKLVEPPSCSSASTVVFIGKNSRGNWVAQEQNGLYGGLFVNRAQAVKYALFENGHHPETIVELPREIELDMGGKLPSSDSLPASTRHVA
jgi:hypothetical protein